MEDTKPVEVPTVTGPTEEEFRTTLNSVLDFIKEYKDEDLKCPVTKNRAVAVCLNPKAPRQVLCTMCLVRDGDFVRAYRSDILPIEELKSKLVEGIQTFVKTEKSAVVQNIDKLKEKLKTDLLHAVSKEFDSKIDEKLKEFFTKFENSAAHSAPEIENPTAITENPLAPVPEGDDEEDNEEDYEDIDEDSDSDSHERPPVRKQKSTPAPTQVVAIASRKNWAAESKEVIAQAIKDNQDPEVLLSLYKRISQDKTVRAKLLTTEMLGSNDKNLEESKKTILGAVHSYVDIFSSKLSSTLDEFPPLRSEYVLRRFNSSSQPYNYTNTLNSLLFMVSVPAIFYGYSQYITTSPNIPIDFQIVKGTRARDRANCLLRSQMEIKNEQDPLLTQLIKLTGTTTRTYPVIFPMPLRLEANVWYHISFNKPGDSHYIVYGSSPIHANGERYPFSNGNKQISFRKAEDDTIDNGPSIGQFPDFYIN